MIPRPPAAALIMLAALILTACNGSGSSSSTPAAGARVSATTTTTTATTTTTSTSPGAGKPQVTVGDNNTTEQFVLGELYYEALKAQGFSVLIDQNIGPDSIRLQQLQSGGKNGGIDMYPEYLNVWNAGFAGDTRHFRGWRRARLREHPAANPRPALSRSFHGRRAELPFRLRRQRGRSLRAIHDRSRTSSRLSSRSGSRQL